MSFFDDIAAPTKPITTKPVPVAAPTKAVSSGFFGDLVDTPNSPTVPQAKQNTSPTLPVVEKDNSLSSYTSNYSRMRDLANSFTQGIYDVPEAITGILDIFTKGYAGKAIESAEKQVLGSTTKDMREYLQTLKSPAQKVADTKVAQAKGFVPTVQAAVQNPSTIASTVAESIPSMLAGGVVSRSVGGLFGLAGKYGIKIPASLLGAIGEGSISAGQTAEQTRQGQDSGLLTGAQATTSGVSGALTSVLGAFGGKLAQKLGVADVETLLAGGTTETVKKSIVLSAVKGALAESAFEELPQSMQEQIASNLNNNRPWYEGVVEAGAMGALAAIGMGGTVAGVSQAKANREVKTFDQVKEDIIKENKDNPVIKEYVKNEDTFAKVMDYIESTKEVETPEEVLAKLTESGIEKSTAMKMMNESALKDIRDSAKTVDITPDALQADIDSFMSGNDTSAKTEKIETSEATPKPATSEGIPFDFEERGVTGEVLTQATKDWNSNYQDEFQTLKDALVEIDDSLKGSKGERKLALTSRKSTIEEQLKQKEIEFTDKYLKPEKTENSKKTEAIFNASKDHEEVKVGDTTYEIGSFGKNAFERKSGKEDRFPQEELAETLEHVEHIYRASADKSNYRYDNAVHVAEMPNREQRAVYTRVNKNGKEEIINWHKISNDKYVEDLSKNGTFGGSRTHAGNVRTVSSKSNGEGDTSLAGEQKESNIVDDNKEEKPKIGTVVTLKSEGKKGTKYSVSAYYKKDGEGMRIKVKDFFKNVKWVSPSEIEEVAASRELSTELVEEKVKTLNGLYAEMVPEFQRIEDTTEDITEMEKLREKGMILVLDWKNGTITDEEFNTKYEALETAYNKLLNVLFQRQTGLTLKTLQKIEGRKTVSKQFISDLTNASDIKQVEKDLLREALLTEGETVSVPEFIEKVKRELLPLERKSASGRGYRESDRGIDGIEMVGGARYENVSLPAEIRGNVANYSEQIYESPVKTSSGNVHFSGTGDNYFGHTRIEDMTDGKTRRVIEVQSDLYQKGNLENDANKLVNRMTDAEKKEYDKLNDFRNNSEGTLEQRDKAWERMEQLRDEAEKRIGKVNEKLAQYNDPTAHFRMVREEVSQAAKDEKTTLLFPTGETAMKIEGLGEYNNWFIPFTSRRPAPVDLKVGSELVQGNQPWIITRVDGDGKFQAVPMYTFENVAEESGKYPFPGDAIAALQEGSFPKSDLQGDFESFDISGKIDTNNPIYRFYEKDLGRYLKNKYNAEKVTDDKGATWYEVKITPDMATSPVEAFQRQMTANDKKTSFEEGKKRLESYKKRLKLDFDVDFVHTINTGEYKRNGENVYARAVTYNNKISLTDNLTETTADHELVHIVVDNIEKINAFEGITKDALLTAQNGGKEYTPEDVERLGEELAIGFEAKVKGANQSHIPQVIVNFYDKLQTLLTKTLRALGVEINVIGDFYDRLKYAKGITPVRFEGHPLNDRIARKYDREGREFLDFSFQQMKEMDDIRKRNFERFEEEDLKINPDNFSLDRKDLGWFNNLFAGGKDIYLSNRQEFEAAGALDKISDTRLMYKASIDQKMAESLKPYFKLSPYEMDNVNIILVEGDRDRQEYGEDYLKGRGLTDKEILGYQSVRSAFKSGHDLILSELEKNGAKKEQLNEFRRELRGYIPHKWKYDNAVKVYELTEKGRKRYGDPGTLIVEINKNGPAYAKTVLESGYLKITSMNTYPTPGKAKQAVKELSKEGEISIYTKLTSLSVDFFSEQRFSIGNMRSVIAQAKVSSDVKNQLLEGLSDMVKEKGFGRQYIHRGGVAGYETDELGRVIANYFSGLAGFVGKMEAGKRYFDVLESIQERDQPKFYAWVRDTIAFDMGNDAQTISLGIPGTEYKVNLKEAAFIFHLADDLSYLLVNATQNLTIGVGELSILVDNKIAKHFKPEVEILKAMSDWALGRLTEDEYNVVSGLLRVGRLGGELTGDLMGFKNNPLYRTISSSFRKALFNTSAMIEQNINRVPAFLAARRLLQAKGVSGRELNERALEISDTIHIHTKKTNTPRSFRGSIASTAFVFQNFTRAMLYGMKQNLSDGEFMALGKKLFYTALLGGYASLPFAKLILALYHWLFPEPDKEKKKELDSWALALELGLPASFANIDLSGRVSIDIMSITNLFDGQTPNGTAGKLLDIRTYVGGTGGVFTRIFDMYSLASQGRILEAAGKLPDFVGNPLKAYQGMTKGIYSKAGNPLMDDTGKPFQYTPYEAFLKATGFTPTREDLAWEESSKEWIAKTIHTEKAANAQSQIKGAILLGDIEKAKKLQADALKKGDLTDTSKDYVQVAVKEKTMSDSVEKWKTGTQNRATLDRLETDLAKAIYGNGYSKTQLTNVTKEFAFYREFGFDDELANSILDAKTTTEKASILKQARASMGLEEFKKFYERGRKKVVYEPTKTGSANSGYILITDPVREAYLKK